MYKRPLPKIVVAVDPSTLKYAPVENSIVYKLRHVIPVPPFKPKPHVPIALIEDLTFGLRRHGATEEEIEEVRRKNHYVPSAPVPKKNKKKVRQSADDDLDKVFSQFSTKPAVKKKMLKAVVKKI